MASDYLSQEKYQELSKELEDLRTNRRRAVAGRLESAKSLGDLAENAEFHAAREEQAEIEDRIGQIENLLRNADIISKHHSLVAELGSTVVVKKDGDKEHRLTIVGSEEADLSQAKLSYQSPLGAELLGKRPGEQVTVETPRGPVRYTLIGVE